MVELEERLSNILDESQAIRDIPNFLGSDGFVDVKALPRYKLDTGNTIQQEMQRFTTAELMEFEARVAQGLDPHDHPNTQAFWDLRQTALILGGLYDEGKRHLVFQDEADSSIICLRVSLFLFPSLNVSCRQVLNILFVIRYVDSRCPPSSRTDAAAIGLIQS